VRIGVDESAPKELVDVLRQLGARLSPIGPRPRAVGGGLGTESAAAFDFYVQMKAKELGIDLASIPEPTPGGRGGGRGLDGRGAGGPGANGDPGNPTGMAALTRWTNGRFGRGFEFVQAQRRRYALITEMAALLKDFDMYVPGQGNDIGLHAQTGHPCVVLPYKFEPPPAGRGGRGGAVPDSTPPVQYNSQPICTVIAGNLYQDDKILSVANQYQMHTDWHTKHPAI